MIRFNKNYKKEPILFSFIRLHVFLSLIATALLFLIIATYFFMESSDQMIYKVTQVTEREVGADGFTASALLGNISIPMESIAGNVWYHPGLWNNFLFHPIHLFTSIFMLLLLYLIFRNLDYSKPFVSSVAKYIYGLAWLLIGDFFLCLSGKFRSIN